MSEEWDFTAVSSVREEEKRQLTLLFLCFKFAKMLV